MTMNQFSFKNFESDSELVFHCSKALDQVLEAAPNGSHIAAQIEKIDLGYAASLEVYSNRGPFLGRSFSMDPKKAVTKVVESTLQKINRRKAGRELVQSARPWNPPESPSSGAQLR